MVAEVENYDMYLTGQIYGYMVEPVDANKNIECDDSCWGFYGDEGIKQIISEAKSGINFAINDYKEKTVAGVRAERKRRSEMNYFIKTAWAF